LSGLSAFQDGERLVVVDAFEVFRFDAKPGDAAVFGGAFGHIADEVFDEDGGVVGAFGDGFFVRAFEHAVEFATGAVLDEADGFLNEDGFFAEAEGEADVAALVVGTPVADGFGARAEGGDGDVDGHR
jgi:hypothetical protein